MLMCENNEMQSKYLAPQLIIFSFVGDKKNLEENTSKRIHPYLQRQ